MPKFSKKFFNLNRTYSSTKKGVKVFKYALFRCVDRKGVSTIYAPCYKERKRKGFLERHTRAYISKNTTNNYLRLCLSIYTYFYQYQIKIFCPKGKKIFLMRVMLQPRSCTSRTCFLKLIFPMVENIWFLTYTICGDI